jgi:hypothetical protein
VMWMRALARFPVPERLLASAAPAAPPEITEAVAAWQGSTS